jgi:hypothetical protein
MVSMAERGHVAEPLDAKPWLDAQNLGVELRWHSGCILTLANLRGELYVDAYLEKRADDREAVIAEIKSRIQQINANYYSIKTGCGLRLPRGFSGLFLPVARFYDPIPRNAFNDSPAIVPQLMALDQASGEITLAVVMPREGAEHLYLPGEPFCQVIPVPRGDVALRPFNIEETQAA